MNRQALQDPLLPLLRQTAKGDRESFQVLYEQTKHRLTVYLHRMVRDTSCIEDILVETYLQVWKSSNTFKGRSLVLTWMIGIARNLALQEMGRKKYHEDIGDHPELEADGLDTEAGNRKEVLARALGKLSPKHREILDLAFYQDLPYREISHLVQIPESTVKSRIFYAKAALKAALEKMRINSTDL
jgi:RNA polymerase sigma-70 factor (ECF subfamily)